MNYLLLLSLASGAISALLLYLRAGKLQYLAQRPKVRLAICGATGMAVFLLCLQIAFAVIFVVQLLVALSIATGLAYLIIRIKKRMGR